MKLLIIGGLAMMVTVVGTAEAGTVSDPTTMERQRSVETGLCVVRQNRDVVVRMLLADGGTATQNSFMVLLKKCAEAGTKLFPNVVMGAAAENIMADTNLDVEEIVSSQSRRQKFPDNETNRLFACAIAAKPASLTKMLRTAVGSAEELEAIHDFRLALLGCNATRGAGVTPANIRASAARTTFAMANSVQ